MSTTPSSNPSIPSEPLHIPGTLANVTTECMHDMARLTNGLNIRRPKKKMNLMNETPIKACISRFDSGHYTRMQFLRAVSHSVGAHTDTLQPTHDASISDEDDADYTSQRPRHHLLQRLRRLPHRRRHRHLQTTCCEVCLIGQRDGVALVPCGHARFCATCVDTLVESLLAAAGDIYNFQPQCPHNVHKT